MVYRPAFWRATSRNACLWGMPIHSEGEVKPLCMPCEASAEAPALRAHLLNNTAFTNMRTTWRWSGRGRVRSAR